jgi:WhiB family redox-sensing transcriptional regulator
MTQRQIAEAKALCARCPMLEKCRDWAVTSGEPEGIWGGTTPQERRRLRRQPPPMAARAGTRVA